MAIFTKTTKEAKVTKVTKAKKEGALALGSRVNAIVRPHITEKAAILAEKGTYVFEVARDTNKIEIAKAIEALYNVNLPNTRVFVRNRKGVKSGIRKALVTLKKGDKIEVV